VRAQLEVVGRWHGASIDSSDLSLECCRDNRATLTWTEEILQCHAHTTTGGKVSMGTTGGAVVGTTTGAATGIPAWTTGGALAWTTGGAPAWTTGGAPAWTTGGATVM